MPFLPRRRVCQRALALGGWFGLASAIPDPGSAQPLQRVWRVGRLAVGRVDPQAPQVRAQTDGLAEQGFVEGRNVEFVWRWASGSVDELPRLAAELVAAKVDVIWTGNNNATLAAARATSTIPIVMTLGTDAVKNGLIDSFARPGRNVTGLSSEAGQEMHGKHLALLKELVPGLRRVAVLVQEGIGEDQELILDAMQKLGLQGVPVPKVSRPQEIEPVFAAMKRGGAEAYLGIGGSILYSAREQVAALARTHRLPGVHWIAQWVEAGCLVSYGFDIVAQYRRSAWYVSRILQGAKPADLPVEQPSRYELAVNLGTARALGISVPASLLARADKVVQ